MGGLYDEFRTALHAVWARRWLALAVAWVVCLGGWLVVSQIPNQYESRARIFVQLRQILPNSPNSAVNPVDQQRDIDRIRQTLTAAVNLEKVVRGTDLAATVTNDRQVAARIAGLQKAIKVTAQQDNLFEISATIANAGASDAANAKLSRQIVQKLIDIFVEGNLSEGRDSTSRSLRFIDAQLEQRQRQLQEAEQKRSDFQSRFLASLPGTGSLDERIQAARAQLSQVNADLTAAQTRLAALNGQMASTPQSVAGAGGATATAGPARARVSAIQGQLAEARGRGWTDNHPDVVALRNQLAAAQNAARGEPVTMSGGGGGASANPMYLTLRSMQVERSAAVAELSQRKAQLESDLQTLETKLAAEPGMAAEQSSIDRDYRVLKDAYEQLRAQREQVSLRAQAESGGETVRFSVIDPPTAPSAPTAPNRPLLLTAVLIAGIGAGLAAAFAMSRIHVTYPNAPRLERASGLPVIGSIGEVLTEAQIAWRRKRLRMFAGAASGLAVAWIALIGVEFVQRGMVA